MTLETWKTSTSIALILEGTSVKINQSVFFQYLHFKNLKIYNMLFYAIFPYVQLLPDFEKNEV